MSSGTAMASGMHVEPKAMCLLVIRVSQLSKGNQNEYGQKVGTRNHRPPDEEHCSSWKHCWCSL